MSYIDLLALFSWFDAAAITWFFVAWAGIGWWIDHPHFGRKSVTSLMKGYRRAWMREMVFRDPRIFDAQMMGSLRQGTAFFASSSIIAVGGVLALSGNTAPLQGVAADISGQATPAIVWQLKLVIVALCLVSAFLKFVWANRLFGYCVVLMAAVPTHPDHPDSAPRATRAAELNIRAAVNFNRGLRAIYFALAAVAWLIGPIPLILSVSFTFWVLWSREFASLPHQILSGPPPSAKL